MGAAANACNSAMSSGTIYIQSSGNTSTQMALGSSKKIDGYSCTITGNAGNCIIRCNNCSSVGAQNMTMAGSLAFGMYFSTDNGQAFSAVNGTSGIAYRIDNCKGGTGYTFSCGSPTLTSGSDNGVETYGISGNSWSKVTATSRGACGVLLNYSSSASGGTVTANKCNYGGGYAGFRTANNNRSTTLTYDNATSCGRGFFSVSGSGGATLTRVNATSCSGIGIWIGSVSKNVKVNGGTITGCSSCWTDSNPSSYGNVVTVTCK
jgi:hypothetical protein